MSTVAKILAVVNALLAGGFLASAASYLGEQDHWRYKHTQVADAKVQSEKDLNDQISGLRSSLGTSDQRLREAQAERDKATTENARLDAENQQLRSAYTSISENLSLAQRMNDRMTSTISQNRDLIQAQGQQLQTLRSEIATLQEDRGQKLQILNSKELDLRRAQQQLKKHEGDIARLREELREKEFALAFYRERYPGVEAVSQPAHSGKIMYANPGANVYTISLGAEDGVKPGFEYMVSRGRDYVGTIVIDEVSAKKSSGRALRDISKGEIQIGDDINPGS